MITRPTGLSLADWSNQIVLDLSSYGAIGKLVDENAWQDWAAQLFLLTGLPQNMPQPYGFDNWLDWAERLCQTL